MRGKYLEMARIRESLNDSYRKNRNAGADNEMTQRILEQSQRLDSWVFDVMNSTQNNRPAAADHR